MNTDDGPIETSEDYYLGARQGREAGKTGDPTIWPVMIVAAIMAAFVLFKIMTAGEPTKKPPLTSKPSPDKGFPDANLADNTIPEVKKQPSVGRVRPNKKIEQQHGMIWSDGCQPESQITDNELSQYWSDERSLGDDH